MDITALPLRGCYVLKLTKFFDDRGSFVKTLHVPGYSRAGLTWNFREGYYSTSKAGVIRGMHLQLPPYEHTKLVYCLHGQALDVLVDVRNGESYGRHCAIAMDSENPVAVYVAPGIAHGFLAQTDCTLHYLVTHEHVPTHDAGIRYDSFGFDWGVQSPILSERDRLLPPLRDFSSPFGSLDSSRNKPLP